MDAEVANRCSFCQKLAPEVDKLIAGPGIYICDQCVHACVEILEQEGDDLGAALAIVLLFPVFKAGQSWWGALPEVMPAQGTRRMRVGVLLGCVQDTFFSHVNAATARVLAAEGCEVVMPQPQPCCGARTMTGS